MADITPHPQSVSLTDREERNTHKAAVLWFTGLSGSGKSTLAMALQERLFKNGCQVTVMDGDNIRYGLNAGLGFKDEDRRENVRRVAEVSKLFAESGLIVLASLISPYQQERDKARKIIEPLNFLEIYVEVDLATAKNRDSKGLYKKAQSGEIKNFTGIHSAYEVPEHPDLVISNAGQSVIEGTNQLMNLLKAKQIIT